MIKLSKKEFDRIVRRAIQRIPREIRRQMHNILISVQKRPSKQLLAEMAVPAHRGRPPTAVAAAVAVQRSS